MIVGPFLPDLGKDIFPDLEVIRLEGEGWIRILKVL